jgi:NADH-quinone oxidoreductase subunit N
MSLSELIALLPLIITVGVAVALMLVIAIARHHGLSLALTISGLVVQLALLPLVAHHVPITVTPLLEVDVLAVFYMGLVTLAAIVTALLIYGYVSPRDRTREELYLLLVITLLGALVLVSSRHFAAFFLGLELISVPFFAMLAYPRWSPQPLEAGIKYLTLSSMSSALILFGMALIYAKLGVLGFAAIGERLSGAEPVMTGYFLGGTALLIAGVGFKLSLVPFHMWTPDVYQGAPAPVVGFLATVSKGAVLVLLMRYFFKSEAYAFPPVITLLELLAGASMIVGNLLALLQNNIKRILAYSSITHFGYLLVAFLAAGELGIEAVGVYLVAYFVMTLGAFGVLTVCATGAAREVEALADYSGLAWHRPWLGGIFTVMVLSLAGIPLTAGFMAKFYVFTAGVDSAMWILLGLLVATSIMALFYYLRIIVVLFTAPSEDPLLTAGGAIPRISAAVLTVLTAVLIGLGIYPTPLVETVRNVASSLL